MESRHYGDSKVSSKSLKWGHYEGILFRHKIFVGSLSDDTTTGELVSFFSAFGHVIEAKILVDPIGKSRGYGFVTFECVDTVDRILSLGDIFFKGKRLIISCAVKRQRQPERRPSCTTILGPHLGLLNHPLYMFPSQVITQQASPIPQAHLYPQLYQAPNCLHNMPAQVSINVQNPQIQQAAGQTLGQMPFVMSQHPASPYIVNSPVKSTYMDTSTATINKEHCNDHLCSKQHRNEIISSINSLIDESGPVSLASPVSSVPTTSLTAQTLFEPTFTSAKAGGLTQFTSPTYSTQYGNQGYA